MTKDTGAIQHIFSGTCIDTPELGKVRIMLNALLAVDHLGKIVTLIEDGGGEEGIHAYMTKVGDRAKVAQIHQLGPHEFLFPGLIDTHIHAPQYAFTGTGGDTPLLEWLEKYTFPHESRFEQLEHARHVYGRCVRRLLRNGTTTAAYFATKHVPATKVLADTMHRLGQRGWVGKVCMDANSPKSLQETHEEALQGTQEIIAHVQSLNSPLIRPCITPRFAISCTEKTMRALGDLAISTSLPVQSHLSENQGECQMVKTLFSDHDHYTGVYHASGLLGPSTIMAHCIHLSPEEKLMIQSTGTGISHCPGSNFSLRSGILNVRSLLDQGISVGLGTDVSGGYGTSIMGTMREAITASRILHTDSERRGDAEVVKSLNLEEVLYLGTQGGAAIMGLAKEVGSFEVGKSLDALRVNLGAGIGEEDVAVDVFDHDGPRERLEKWINLGDDRTITHVWVAGRLVHSTLPAHRVKGEEVMALKV
ncbi:MAG: guanine deaminase-like protein [Piptocephalis tieghemiana]|nr:MAG: guanine deaminase-like protein [Piptocephalis tieghemiana]